MLANMAAAVTESLGVMSSWAMMSVVISLLVEMRLNSIKSKTKKEV